MRPSLVYLSRLYSRIYFITISVQACGPISERGVVVNVLDAAFDVLVFKYGVIKRVYVNVSALVMLNYDV